MGGATSGAAGTTGTTGTAGTAASGAQYILSDAKPATGSASSTAGTSGMAPSASEYQLRAEDASVNLSQHLNHQIEVTGRVASSSSMPSGGTTGATGTTGASRSGDKPTLTVTSIKMIAAGCK